MNVYVSGFHGTVAVGDWSRLRRELVHSVWSKMFVSSQKVCDFFVKSNRDKKIVQRICEIQFVCVRIAFQKFDLR